MVIAEAYACGVPVIAAGHGGLAEIVRDGSTGLHFAPGNVDDLAAKVEWAWRHTQEMEAMGRSARKEFETKYNASAALNGLECAYESVLASSNKTTRSQKGIRSRVRPMHSWNVKKGPARWKQFESCSLLSTTNFARRSAILFFPITSLSTDVWNHRANGANDAHPGARPHLLKSWASAWTRYKFRMWCRGWKNG